MHAPASAMLVVALAFLLLVTPSLPGGRGSPRSATGDVASERAGVCLAQPGGPTPSCETERPLFLTLPYTRGPDVYELQDCLSRLGFYLGAVNGAFTLELQDAVRKFQAACGIPASGVVTQREWDSMFPLALSLGKARAVECKARPRPQGAVELKVDTASLTLSVLADGAVYATYPVAVGKPSTPTPVGEWKVIHKGGSWGGAFGTRWLGLNVPWGIYGIHGTNKPYSIGRMVSHGCIRMHNRHIEEFYPWVREGCNVTITGNLPRSRVASPLAPGATGVDVVRLQLALRYAGFEAGRADGRFGAETQAAVESFRAAHGLPSSPEASVDVLAMLGLR